MPELQVGCWQGFLNLIFLDALNHSDGMETCRLKWFKRNVKIGRSRWLTVIFPHIDASLLMCSK